MTVETYLIISVVLTALSALLYVLDQPYSGRAAWVLLVLGVIAFELAHWPTLAPN